MTTSKIPERVRNYAKELGIFDNAKRIYGFPTANPDITQLVLVLENDSNLARKVDEKPVVDNIGGAVYSLVYTFEGSGELEKMPIGAEILYQIGQSQ